MKHKAVLFKKGEDKKVHCFLCSHKCTINPDQFGICGVRQNMDGTLYSLIYGEAIAFHIDPIEKKPLYHFLPGSLSYSVATIGCNFRCGFCQNWQISQTNKKDGPGFPGKHLLPRDIVRNAKSSDCKSIAYTYTEPTIFFEYAYDTAKLARKQKLYNIFVTNGFMTKQAIDMIQPYLDAANIDLKSARNEFYQSHCKAKLQPVMDNIAYMKKKGIWVEVTTLIIPMENDSEKELQQIAEFIANISKDIPWHISRFHPQFQMQNTPITAMQTLQKAFKAGKKAGLKYVYLGNVYEGNETICPECQNKIIERIYFNIKKQDVKDGKCTHCGTKIAGVWK